MNFFQDLTSLPLVFSTIYFAIVLTIQVELKIALKQFNEDRQDELHDEKLESFVTHKSC